jgi:hypothetical protein
MKFNITLNYIFYIIYSNKYMLHYKCNNIKYYLILHVTWKSLKISIYVLIF